MVVNGLKLVVVCSLVSSVVKGDKFSVVVEESGGLFHSSTGLLQLGTTHNCRSSWGVYGTDPFTSTQHNHVKIFPFDDFHNYKDTDGDTDGLFVFARQQFAFCVITKVGSTQWGEVLRKIAVHNSSVSGKNYHDMKQEWKEIESSFKGTPAEKMAVFSNQHAIRAVFVRDPIERFASAFTMLCPTETYSFLTMKAAVEWASKRNLAQESDGHWRLQSSNCELESRIKEYNIIGLYSKDHFAEDSACVLKLAGLSQFNVFGESDRIDYRNNWSSNNTAEETTLLQRLFTREGANSLFLSYQRDYAVFKLPKPEWIEGATGELYDVDLRSSHGCCDC